MDLQDCKIIQEPAARTVYGPDGEPLGQLVPVLPDLWRATAWCAVADVGDAFAWCWQIYASWEEIAMMALLDHLHTCEHVVPGRCEGFGVTPLM
ncbi:MAG: hypothetical protein ACRDX8_13070 [Acidimicrobiales bacterium]